MPGSCCDADDQLAQLLDLIVEHVEAVDRYRLATLAARMLARVLEDELNDWPTPRMAELVLGVKALLVPGGLSPEREAQLVSLLERLLEVLRTAAASGLERTDP